MWLSNSLPIIYHICWPGESDPFSPYPPLSLSYRFKTHLNAHAPKDVLSAEEYEGLLEESKQSHKTEKSELAEGEEELPPGEEKEPTEVDYKWQIPSSVGLRFNMRFNVFQMLPK